MTNEEIDKAARRMFEIIPSYYDKYEAAEIADVLRELVVQAYKEAAQAICYECGTGEAPFPTAGYQYTHGFCDGGKIVHDCDASDIHKLRDCLVAETVSS